MFGEIVPEKTSSRVVHERQALIESVAVILRTLTAPINNGPNLLYVVGSGGSIGPQMSIGRDVPAVVEVVQHPELQGQFVLVGGNLSSIHRQGGIAIARSQIAEDLVVGAIFFQNVDYMPDRILTSGKLNLVSFSVQQVIFFNLACIEGQVSVNIFPPKPLNGSSDQRRNVRMRIGMQSCLHRSLHIVQARCFRLWHWR